MSCSEKLKLELARNALMQCFSADNIYSSNWSSAGRDQFSYFWFWNISSSFKVVKTFSFNIFQMKKTLQFSALQVFLSKYNLIMPTIPKLSWKYCRSPKTEFLFVFLFFISFFFSFLIYLFLVNHQHCQEFCFSSGFESGKKLGQVACQFIWFNLSKLVLHWGIPLYEYIKFTFDCVLGLPGQVLVAEGALVGFLWEAAESFPHVQQSQGQLAPGWTHSGLGWAHHKMVAGKYF